MRKIKEILRFHLLAGVTSYRWIARAVGCGKTAVAECLQLPSGRDEPWAVSPWRLVRAA